MAPPLVGEALAEREIEAKAAAGAKKFLPQIRAAFAPRKSPRPGQP
jgi:hypothetical protein